MTIILQVGKLRVIDNYEAVTKLRKELMVKKSDSSNFRNEPNRDDYLNYLMAFPGYAFYGGSVRSSITNRFRPQSFAQLLGGFVDIQKVNE